MSSRSSATPGVLAPIAACAALLVAACTADGGASFDAGSLEDGAPPGWDAGDVRPLPDGAAPPTDGSVTLPDTGTDAGAEPCLPVLASCAGGETCCGDLSCGSTTAGTVCCGGEGASCATAGGEDCCDDLLCVGGRCQPAGGDPPRFSAPYPCGQRWTYSHHSAEVRLALDFIRADGGETFRTPNLASAPGVAYRRSEPGGAGQYVVIEHGDGWRTYYFHLDEYSVPDGTWVSRGDPIGLTGSTGASSGPHIHYEQLRGSAGQTIHIEGVSLAPYPGSYGSRHLVSENGCGEGGRAFDTWGSDRPVHERPSPSSPLVTTLAAPTRVHVDCQTRGETVSAEGYTNDWWSHLRDEDGYISNIYIADPSAMLAGVPLCP